MLRRALHETSSVDITPDRLVSMQEAMDYLSEKGLPCRSRSTFYRVIREFGIEYVDTNPNGKNEMRKFAKANLDHVLQQKGLIL